MEITITTMEITTTTMEITTKMGMVGTMGVPIRDFRRVALRSMTGREYRMCSSCTSPFFSVVALTILVLPTLFWLPSYLNESVLQLLHPFELAIL
ncbi:hypothetical protein Tco_1504526 [Tanacetum coccineum]